jgi:ABC-2 type transport system ATP-binding protein
MSTKELIVRTNQVYKRYGATTALAGLDLEVERGTVFGLLGPNAAGKTTVVRVLSTLLTFDSGSAEVSGFDVVRQAEQIRHSIGLAGQYVAVDEILPGRTNLEMFGRLFHLSRSEATVRADELLQQFDLMDAAERQVKTYSGGMRRRLDLASSLIRRPQVLFLDEPTTGLDPSSRRQVWDSVRSLVADGTTVLLTTQYLEEADQLANRIAVINSGCVIAEGTPEDLKQRVGGDQIELVIERATDLAQAAAIAGDLAGIDVKVDRTESRIRMPVKHRARATSALLNAMSQAEIEVADVSIRRPTLDDVFLNLVGQSASGPDSRKDDAV